MLLPNLNYQQENAPVSLAVSGFPKRQTSNDEWPGSVCFVIGEPFHRNNIFHGAFHTSVRCARDFREMLAHAIMVTQGRAFPTSFNALRMDNIEGGRNDNPPIGMGASALGKHTNPDKRQVCFFFAFGPLHASFWTPTDDAIKFLVALDGALARAILTEKA